MNEIEYMLDKLRNRLLKDNININNNDLLEIVNLYDNLYGFLKEQKLTSLYKYRYQFLYEKEVENPNYDIIKSLIELKSFNAFYLLDYPTLLHKFTGGMYHFNNLLDVTNKLDLLLSTYLTYLYSDYNDLEELYIRDHFDVIENNINNNYADIIDSKYVSSEEKDVIAKYNEIFIKYYSLCENDNYYKDNMFDMLLDISYAYLISNNLINNSYDKVMNFLNNIHINILDINHKLIVSGIETEEELLNVVKSLYKNNKVLNKKQIN